MNKNEVKNLASLCSKCVTKPCQMGCPLNNDTTEFIHQTLNENYKEAFDTLCNTTVLMALCGKICPHEKQCQGSCARKLSYESVKIGEIESFIGDLAIEKNWEFPKSTKKVNKSVAIVGSGPASLTCAQFLIRNGIDVTIYEKHNHLGGLLNHGIPAFRLNKDLVNNVCDMITKDNVKVCLNKELGKDIFLDSLSKDYDAVFLGFGANISSKMNILGEELNGVYGGNELLEYNLHPDYNNKKVLIIGGGNVAMDVSRTVIKKGCKNVVISYRRDETSMPAEIKEIKEAKEEGVEFMFQTNLVSIHGDKSVEKVEFVKTELKQIESQTRLTPVDVKDSNFLVDFDYVIMAVGSKPEKNILESLKLELNPRGYIKVNSNNQTSIENVFAGGDLIGNKSTVAWASRSGRNSAYSILSYLK